MAALPQTFTTDSPQPDLAEAQRLLDQGFTLVRLHHHSKRPVGDEWNKHAATRIDTAATGYGIPLVPNNLCSIDPDHMDMARVGFKAWGFDLDAILAQGVRTASTRPGSGGRSAFAADEFDMLRWLPFSVFNDDGKGITVLELRAQSPNLQDVVPGLVYADKVTGGLCTQQYANGLRFDDAPALPDDFARFWRMLSTDDDALRQHSKQFVDAIIAAGFTVHGKRPQYRTPMGSGEKLAFPAPGYRGDYNARHPVPEILNRHNYPQDRRTQRYSHPGATGAPGIRPIPDKDGLWRSDHAGDPLHGAFDAWAAHVQLDHKGDVDTAKAAIDAERAEAAKEAPDSAESLFNPPQRGCLELPESLLETPVGALVRRASYCLEFPPASTALTFLAAASAAVSMGYAVRYRTGTAISPGLYAVVQQPPSMHKSQLLSMAMQPYARAVGQHNRRIWTYNDAQEKDMPRRAPTFDSATDATSAALDQYLAGCAEGRFFIASAEQSAFQTLFPEKPDAFSSNSELLLKGWQGEYVASLRKGRNAFRGVAFGAVAVIAQPGSAQRVFNASNGSGLAERFLYAAEPSPLGSRQLHGEFVTRQELRPYDDAITECVEQYSERVMAMPVDAQEVLEPSRLHYLDLSPEGYRLLLETRRKQEPRLGALARQGELVQVGWLGKIETHTMKVAAVLHVLNSMMLGQAPADIIPTDTVATALDLVQTLGRHLETLLHDSGETGEAAEVDSVADLLAATRRGVTPRVLAQKLRKRHPFRAMGDEAYSRARARVDAMLASGQLIVNVKGDVEHV